MAKLKCTIDITVHNYWIVDSYELNSEPTLWILMTAADKMYLTSQISRNNNETQ